MMMNARKRTRSTSNNNNSKHWKYQTHKRSFVPPTKFLLGGNIQDPLNLTGLQNGTAEDIAVPDEVEEPKRKCVKGGPDFLFGGNIHDPLNLKSITAEEENHPEDQPHSSSGLLDESGQSADVARSRSESITFKSDAKDILKKCERRDKIVSPVVPQPYLPLKNPRFRHQIITPEVGREKKVPKFKPKNARFKYGNYDRYYGYRNANNIADARLDALKKHKHLFEGKDVLDIGCNIGHIALTVARDFGAKSVVGIDIDGALISIAKKNVRRYAKKEATDTADTNSEATHSESMARLYRKDCAYDGNLEGSEFPKNVTFFQGNYVLSSDSLLSLEKPKYDAILCFSITKWLHLNWGDDGLKRAFKRMYAQLRPGGTLLLEPQSWDSYKKKRKLTENIWRNYINVEFFPHHFDRYLLSSEVGFSRCQTLTVINHAQKGFRRPIKLFTKSETEKTPNNVTSPEIKNSPEKSIELGTSVVDPSDWDVEKMPTLLDQTLPYAKGPLYNFWKTPQGSDYDKTPQITPTYSGNTPKDDSDGEKQTLKVPCYIPLVSPAITPHHMEKSPHSDSGKTPHYQILSPACPQDFQKTPQYEIESPAQRSDSEKTPQYEIESPAQRSDSEKTPQYEIESPAQSSDSEKTPQYEIESPAQRSDSEKTPQYEIESPAQRSVSEKTPQYGIESPAQRSDCEKTPQYEIESPSQRSDSEKTLQYEIESPAQRSDCEKTPQHEIESPAQRSDCEKTPQHEIESPAQPSDCDKTPQHRLESP